MVLKTIQTGTASMTTAETSKNVTITSIDTTKAYLIFNCWGNAGASVISSFVRGKITSATNITFERFQTDTQTVGEIRWQVVEFLTGVTVQRGDQTLSDGENNNTISSVTTSKAWATVTEYGSNDGVYLATKNFATVKITSSTNLRIIEKGTGNQYAHWQAIEMDQCSVQAITDKSLDKAATSTTSTITSVTTGMTAMMGAVYESTSQTNTGFQYMWTWYLSAATTVTWVRESADSSLDWVGNAFVISFSGPIKGVQRGRESWSTSTNSVTPTLTAVTIANSQAWLNGEYGYILQTNNNEAFSERSMFDAYISSTTQLTIARAWHGGKNGQTPWEVTDFSATAHEPSVYDSVTVSENLSVSESVPDLTISVFDTASVSEALTEDMPLGPISIFDAATVSEALTEDMPLGDISVFDSASVSEDVNTASEETLEISIFDSVTVTENLNVRKSGVGDFMPFFTGNTTL